jgi:hypothetical protein
MKIQVVEKVDSTQSLLAQEVLSLQQEIKTLTIEEARDVRAYLKLLSENRYPDALSIQKAKFAMIEVEKESIIQSIDPSLTEIILKHANRQRWFCDRRAMYYAILLYRYGLKKTEIGVFFVRDHSTIVSGMKRFIDLVSAKDDQTMIMWEKNKKWLLQTWDFTQKEPRLVDNIKRIKQDFNIKGSLTIDSDV